MSHCIAPRGKVEGLLIQRGGPRESLGCGIFRRICEEPPRYPPKQTTPSRTSALLAASEESGGSAMVLQITVSDPETHVQGKVSSYVDVSNTLLCSPHARPLPSSFRPSAPVSYSFAFLRADPAVRLCLHMQAVRGADRHGRDVALRVRRFFVRRRYRDFLWLRGQLTTAFPGSIVPPLPPSTSSTRGMTAFRRSSSNGGRRGLSCS